MNFTAIDFETANYFVDSACAVGVVKIKENKIVEKEYFLIRPHSKWFQFTNIHGITWDDVKNEPTFDEIWPCIKKYFRGVEFLAAHNASFDRRVLEACCNKHSIEIPNKRFECTLRLSRQLWTLESHRLPCVCDHLKIKLKHHDALSDALACAKIILHATRKEKIIL